jgi:hypothetical protein
MDTASQIFDIAGTYFGASEDTIVEDESLGEPRYADRSEVVHTVSVSLYYWEKAWESMGADKCDLKGKVADAMFFYPLNYASPNGSSPTILR